MEQRPCQGATLLDLMHSYMLLDPSDLHNLTCMRYLLVLLGKWAADAPLDTHDGVTALMLAALRDDAVQGAANPGLDQGAANPRLCYRAGHIVLWHAMLSVDNRKHYG